MATLDTSLVFAANPRREPPNILGTLSQAMPIAQQMQQQRKQEQITDIFARNIETTPEGTLQLNKQSVLAELYQVDPTQALKFETAYSQIAPTDDLGLKAEKLNLEQRKFGLAERKFGLDEKKLQAKIDQFAKGGLDPEAIVKIEGTLRGEFIKQNLDFQKVGNAYNRIQASKQNIEPTGASDMSLVFNFMKMLDPGSTVREGEFATAAQVGGKFEQWRNLYNKAREGILLGKKARTGIFKQTENLMDAAETGYMRSRKTYRGLSNRNKVNPANVIIDLGRNVEAVEPAAPPKAPPPVGTVRTGDNGKFRFKGGNPADASNWEKI